MVKIVWGWNGSKGCPKTKKKPDDIYLQSIDQFDVTL